MRVASAVLRLAVLGFVLAGTVATASADDSDLRTISHHTDRGRGVVAVATEVAVAKPIRILLKVKSRPDVRVEIKYIIRCRSGEGQREGTSEKLTRRSTQLKLPIFFRKPKDCLLYAEATRDKPNSNRKVKLSIRVRAEQRPGAPFRAVFL